MCPGCLLGSGVHPDGPTAAGERFGFARGPGIACGVASSRAPAPRYLPRAANGGSKAALLLFFFQNNRGETNGVPLRCPL